MLLRFYGESSTTSARSAAEHLEDRRSFIRRPLPFPVSLHLSPGSATSDPWRKRRGGGGKNPLQRPLDNLHHEALDSDRQISPCPRSKGLKGGSEERRESGSAWEDHAFAVTETTDGEEEEEDAPVSLGSSAVMHLNKQVTVTAQNGSFESDSAGIDFWAFAGIFHFGPSFLSPMNCKPWLEPISFTCLYYLISGKETTGVRRNSSKKKTAPNLSMLLPRGPRRLRLAHQGGGLFDLSLLPVRIQWRGGLLAARYLAAPPGRRCLARP